MTNEWWGYIHANGSIQVKRYFGDRFSIDDAKESPFCMRVFEPFNASDRDNAIQIIQEKLK